MSTFTKEQLMNMEEVNLHALAQALEIPNYSEKDREELVYDILDQQDILSASEIENKPKRGRKKKEVEKTTEDGTVTVTEVKVAVTTETVDKVIENTEAGATVILPLTEVAEEGQAVTEAEVAVEALEKIVEAEAALTVEFEGVKVTFESETIKAISLFVLFFLIPDDCFSRYCFFGCCCLY